MQAPQQFTRRKPIVRVVAVLAALFTMWHVFAQFLWIAPASQLRTVIPGDLLTQYQIPLFGQSWSVFAPDPINGDYTFKVRAIVTDDATGAHDTEFIDATKAELSMSYHNLFPPRASNLAVEQASRYKNAYDVLTDKQKELVALGYYKTDDWKERFEQGLRDLADGADQVQKTETFITEADHTNAYATQAARAVWGEDAVVFVSYDIYRQNIVPFYDRYNDDAVRPDKQLTPTGWRGLNTYAEQSGSDFADVFAPLVKEEVK